MNNKDIFINLMELIKVIDRLKEEEDYMNEGAITDKEYNLLMFYFNNILKKL